MSVIGKKKKKIVDWESIEGEYRLGIDSIRSIAAKYNITSGAICGYAKRHKWERDLTEKVQKSTKTKLIQKQVSTEKNTEVSTEKNTEVSIKVSTDSKVSTEEKYAKLIDEKSDEEVEKITKEERELFLKEQAIIEKASNVAVEIIESQREQIDQHRSVYMKIMGNLKEEDVSADNRHEMSRSLNTAMSSLTQAIKLQRQAYNMDDTQDPTRDVTSLLDMIEYEDISNNK